MRPLSFALSLSLAVVSAEGLALADFSGVVRQTSAAVGVDPLGVTTGDFNGDGRPDLVVVNGTSSTVSVLLQKEDGTFADEPGSPLAGPLGPNYAVVADFNGDQRPDIAVVGFVSASVVTFLRNPTDGFTAEDPETVIPQTAGIATADFNGDTRPDYVVSGQDGALVMLRGEAGGFTAEGSPPTSATGRYVAVADFNGDTHPDLAVVNGAAGTVSIFLRVPTGGFIPEGTPIVVGSGPFAIATSDFDRDGKVDLAVTSFDDDTVTIFLRAATGFQREGEPIAVGEGPAGIAAADFDLDGLTDLAVANNTAGTIAILRRLPTGGFAAPSTVSGFPSVYGIVAADFDGNGTPDLAFSQTGEGKATVVLSNFVPPPDAGTEPGDVDASAAPAPLPPAADGGVPAAAPSSGDDGCGCRHVGARASAGGVLLASLVAAVALLRRVRRRR